MLTKLLSKPTVNVTLCYVARIQARRNWKHQSSQLRAFLKQIFPTKGSEIREIFTIHLYNIVYQLLIENFNN